MGKEEVRKRKVGKGKKWERGQMGKKKWERGRSEKAEKWRRRKVEKKTVGKEGAGKRKKLER